MMIKKLLFHEILYGTNESFELM